MGKGVSVFSSRRSRMTLLLLLLIAAGSTGILLAFCRKPLPPVIAAAAGAGMILVWYFSVRHFLAEVSALSTNVDQVLRGTSGLSIRNSEEGELSVLAGELEKLTVQLKTEADQRAEEKRKMSQAMADISHQLRTPLTAMNLNADLLMREELRPEARRQQLHEIRRSLSRMENLVEALLKFAKLDAGTITFRQEPVDVRRMVEKSAEALRIPMELKGQELEIAGDAVFCGDMEWSAEAAGNILKNCMEHTPEGGRICVRITDSPIAAVIVIRDSGAGLPAADIPRIFERFYRGRNSSPESVGIGLALAKEIISGQNGTIRAGNSRDPGEPGAVFTIKFYKEVV
ncbi:MAG: sensor histidine kinase [Eubacterium sp.]|jgi:signal transduction histidine kinase